MDTTYELFDHTADIGIRAKAPTLAGLIGPTAGGLYAVIGELEACGEPEPVEWELTADERSLLLRDYIAELLVLFERDRRIVSEPKVREFSPTRLVVEGLSYAVDDGRSRYDREVKAITYHHLRVVEIPGGFEVTIIVDV